MSNGPDAHAWKLQAFGSSRQYAGNRGYQDDPRRSYRYDSNVANYRQVAIGDIALVEGADRLLGAALICNIETWSGTKTLQRCPNCGRTGLKRRKTLDPPFRCSEGHTFSDPVEDPTDVLILEARFGDSFIATPEALSKTELREACVNFNEQHSIQEVDLDKVCPSLEEARPAVTDLLQRATHPTIFSHDEVGEDDSFSPPARDTRRVSLRKIRLRRGQKRFRESLRDRYGDRCLVSGCRLMEVVQAAHVDPYRGSESHHVQNGLLLRSDLHDLFDLDLLGIHPETLEVHLAPEISDSGYGQFAGRTLRCSDSRRPAQNALAVRWAEFTDRGPATGC